jgi:hypothetical protein
MPHEIQKDMGADLLRALRAHKQLDRTVRKLETQVEPILLELVRELEEHFAEEEASGGYYETLRACFPNLAERLDVLRGEHPLLLEGVRAAAPYVQAIIDTVRRHEHAENELLQRANMDGNGVAD